MEDKNSTNSQKEEFVGDNEDIIFLEPIRKDNYKTPLKYNPLV